MDLFYEENPPLSKRAIPKKLEDFVGQNHLVDPGKPIRTMIESKILNSMILVGPPASGKTTLANIISNEFNMLFIKESALTIDSDSLKKIFNISSKKVLFIDEIHRLNKSKQDMLLGPLERGEIFIIGATTENPLFILQPALRSRVFIFELKPLVFEQMKLIVINALKNDRIFSKYEIIFEGNSLNYLIENAYDIRKALNCIEIILLQQIHNYKNKGREESNIAKDENIKDFDDKNNIEMKQDDLIDKNEEDNIIRIDEEKVKSILQVKETAYSDYNGHYDAISAFIKSVRGSNIDASLYYLALMLESGEDPLFIARRLVILASEDIGLAYPEALSIATSAMLSVEKIGMPEARIILSEVSCLLASLPKSNSAYLGIESALKSVREEPIMKIPEHLKNIEVKSFSKEAKKKYLYPHDFKNHFVDQKYMEQDRRFFRFNEIGFESKLSKWISTLYGEKKGDDKS